MKSNFWAGFYKAIDCEIKDIKEIQGVSGIKHQILSIGIDEIRKRIVIAQDEQDARILSMVQADVQARIKEYNVLMVRPVSINLSMVFNNMALILGSYKLMQTDFKSLGNKDNSKAFIEENKSKIESVISLINPQIEVIQKTKLNLAPILKELIQQLSHLKFIGKLANDEEVSIDFEELINFNPIIHDTTLGICPIPLYEFSVEEAESFLNNISILDNKDILKKHAIQQFFYPPADSLALGLIEKEKYTPKELIKHLNRVPNYGHPFGENEMFNLPNLNKVVDALREKGLVVEGEFSGMEITENGKEQRMKVKFSPRESIFKRLSYLFSFKAELNLKDLFKG